MHFRSWLGLFLLLIFSGLNAAENKPFIWQSSVQLLKNKRYKIQAECRIAGNAYLYCNVTKVTVAFGGGKSVEIKPPPGVPDKSGELVYKAGKVRWGMFADEKPVQVIADFQGCIYGSNGEGDICLLPETLILYGAETIGTAEKSAAGIPEILQNALNKFAPGKVLAGLPDEAVLKSFLAGDDGNVPEGNAPAVPGGGFWAIVLLVVLGGLGLNLTPCVLPMIPVNLAVIGADAAKAGKWRGFRRGAAYGAGITVAYGLLGVLAALGGTGFGRLNSSSLFNWVIAGIFLLLALGMMNVYNIDFTRISNYFPSRKNGGRKWNFPPEITAFGLGIVSALLAGACVAPVVISVVVLSAGLCADGNYWGLLLPFALGGAMALPWPLLGAGMSILPRPGMWMTRVKYIFGIFILGMAVYYGYLGWNLRSGAFNQQTEIKRLAAGLDAAAGNGQRVLIDCWASWCKNCSALEKMLDSKAIKSILQKNNITLIKFRAEKPDDPAVSAFMKSYDLPGLPSLILLEGKR